MEDSSPQSCIMQKVSGKLMETDRGFTDEPQIDDDFVSVFFHCVFNILIPV